MRIVRDIATGRPDGPSVLALGVFDGLHCGHRDLLGRVVDRSRPEGWLSTVVTFDPPPRAVLRPESPPQLIQTLEQRLEGLEALGIDQIAVLEFNASMALTEAEEFIRRYLFKRLDARAVYLGQGAVFGHGRRGNLAMLEELGRSEGRVAVEVPEVRHRGQRISATVIRELIRAGRVNFVRKLLGRPYSMTGTVVSGRGVGRQLLFPTANLRPLNGILPSTGVYATAVIVEGARWPAVTNVGFRPTFGESDALTIETHLIDFRGDLMDRFIRLGFFFRLRCEKRFAGLDELRRQIDQDIARAGHALSGSAGRQSLQSWAGW
ncbi:MAG: riboflavin biosynthesis protein RibF [Acidobacteria bacterium]|nr:riboflavin biosynthesis protein RibF [Acidobacteriota bacterium]